MEEKENDQMKESDSNQLKEIIDLTQAINQFCSNNLKSMLKNSTLQFVEGSLICEFSLKLVNNLPNINNVLQEITIIAEETIVNLGKINPPTPIFTENLCICLQILLKTQKNRTKDILLGLLTSVAMTFEWKNCWISLLELLSLHFNPQKSKVSA